MIDHSPQVIMKMQGFSPATPPTHEDLFMDIGIAMFVTQSSIDIAELAQACEAHGFESLWVPEHPAIPAGPQDARGPGLPTA